MSPELARTPLGEFIWRSAQRSGSGNWLVLSVPESAVSTTAERVATGIEALASAPVERLHAPAGAMALAERPRDATILVVSSLEHFSDEEWRHLDLLRSSLEREGTVVLVLGHRTARSMFRSAPHLASWIGGSTWEMNAEDLVEA